MKFVQVIDYSTSQFAEVNKLVDALACSHRRQANSGPGLHGP